MKRYLIIILLSILLMIGQWGCAHVPSYKPPSLSDQIKAKLGTIGVVSAQFIPKAAVTNTPKGRVSGAAKGLVRGAWKVASGIGPGLGGGNTGSGGGVGELVLATLIVTFVTGGAVVGGIYGAVTATPAIPRGKVNEMDSKLRSALSELKIQEAVRDRVFQEASEQTCRNLVLLEEDGPVSVDEKVNYISLAEKGIDTILEISVLSLEFEGEGERKGQDRKNPLFALSINTRIRLIRTADGSTLFENKLTYASVERKFTDWTTDNAQVFRDELEQAYQSLAKKIVDEVMVHHPTPFEPDTGEPPKPTGHPSQFPTSTSTTRPQNENIINAPIDIVWEKTLQILPTERISLKVVDKKSYFIFGEKHITIWSWGDDVNIHLIPFGDNQTIMQFEAGAKAQLYDWGHEKRMVKDIFTKIKIASEAN